MAQFPDIIADTCSKKENCAQKQQIIIAWLGIGKLAVFLYFDLYETMNTYYILSFYSKYNFTK